MKYVISVILLFVAVVGVVVFLNRSQLVVIQAPLPSDFPADGFSHNTFEGLLSRYVNDAGQVDYDRWHESEHSVAQLKSYLAAVAAYSPDKSPNRFTSRNDELAYWIYAYNAHVIYSVLEHWPIASVTDIKAPIEAIKGLGFFYRQRFEFGGEQLNLLAVENNKIRKTFQDPRIHFVLNCASESCPVIRPELPTGNALETLLASAATDFASDPQNVSVNHDDRQIILSTIFKWYKSDFENDLRAKGLPASGGLVGYVKTIAQESLLDDLARAANYEIVFRDYDWSLNVAR